MCWNRSVYLEGKNEQFSNGSCISIFALKVIPNNNNNKRANVQTYEWAAKQRGKLNSHATKLRELCLFRILWNFSWSWFSRNFHTAPKFELIDVESAIRGDRVKPYEKRRSLSTWHCANSGTRKSLSSFSMPFVNLRIFEKKIHRFYWIYATIIYVQLVLIFFKRYSCHKARFNANRSFSPLFLPCFLSARDSFQIFQIF